MRAIAFQSRPLPADVAIPLHELLERDHRAEAFSPLDPRRTVRRVGGLLTTLGLSATVYRGAVDLRGAEADHVWVVTSAPDSAAFAWVVDAAFPLFADGFVEAMRRFVAGDGSATDVAAAAAAAALADRVLGEFPPQVRYVGVPVWSQRD